ncbi:hypothetical protein G6F31_017766 [Rhizopus arrhizus]|nr:hypothetical protein G6F31_017766 [Rhizopus arrhizus]
MAELPVELEDLATSFNGALARLEDAYNQLEAFNADVAHEMRTPLTNLIGQTQVALSRRRSSDDLQEVLQSNLEELDRLRAMINDMLFLARADRGELAADLAPVHAGGTWRAPALRRRRHGDRQFRPGAPRPGQPDLQRHQGHARGSRHRAALLGVAVGRAG